MEKQFQFENNEKFEEALLTKVRSTVNLLEDEWFQISISEKQKVERKLSVYNGMCDLLDKILADEKNMKERILNRIQNNKLLLFQLKEELNLTCEEADDLTLLELDTFLQNKIVDLTEEKERRLTELKHLLQEDEVLCSYLGEAPYHLPKNLLPIKDDLVLLKNHIEEKGEEKKRRIATYQKLRTEIIAFIEQLEKPLEDDLVVEVVCSESRSCLTSSFLLDVRKLHSDLEFESKELKSQSLELRERISSLWNLLQIPPETKESFLATVPLHTPSCIAKLESHYSEMRELRLQNLGRFIEEVRTQLDKWWDRCYVGDEQKASFPYLTSTDVTEEILDAYEAEVSKWKSYYSQNSNILERVDNFLSLFDNMQQLEAKLKDPSRLFNSRGGALLQEEKERKRVKMALPQVQTQLIEMCSEFEAANGMPFLIDGSSVQEYLTKLWDYHDIQKEKEKSDRNKKKQAVSNPAVGKAVKRGGVVTPAASRKRARDENEHEDRVPKSLRPARGGGMATFSATLFRTPNKGQGNASQCPSTVSPKKKPLFVRNLPAHLTQQLRTNDNPLQNSVSYDNFKTAVTKMDSRELIHNSIICPNSFDDGNSTSNGGIRFCYDEGRQLYLKRTLNLASPVKKIKPSTPKRVSVVGGAAGGAFLKRSLSQPTLLKSPIYLNSNRLWLM